MNCGLLGKTLSHSYSPQIHRLLGDYSYDLYEKSEEELEAFLTSGTFHGLNVTIPYKKAVISYCKALSPQAKKLGAVNTILRQPDGSLIGHNTDYFGFLSMVEHTGLSLENKKVLVLGSGGASNTVVAVLDELKAIPVVISRYGQNNYENLQLHKDCTAIVNATPVGMYPNNGISPIDLSLFPQLEAVLDLIYNPAKTQLILDAEARGLKTENGLWMLVAQAKESAEWFCGCQIANDKIAQIHQKLNTSMKNIILIGMPGCGKSTVGKLLSQKCNRPFIDADGCIEELAGCTIPQIFANEGENPFRAYETQVLAKLSKASGTIIATGGGCVTREENTSLLKQNSQIVWLKREIQSLPTSGRPLSQSHDLRQMYDIRKPLYEKMADLIIENQDSPDQTAEEIIVKLQLEDSQ